MKLSQLDGTLLLELTPNPAEGCTAKAAATTGTASAATGTAATATAATAAAATAAAVLDGAHDGARP
eukprot:7382217-Prymnesium_polylepis.1